MHPACLALAAVRDGGDKNNLPPRRPGDTISGETVGAGGQSHSGRLQKCPQEAKLQILLQIYGRWLRVTAYEGVDHVYHRFIKALIGFPYLSPAGLTLTFYFLQLACHLFKLPIGFGRLLATSIAVPLLAASGELAALAGLFSVPTPFVYIACATSLLVQCLDIVCPSLVFVSFTNTWDSPEWHLTLY